MKSIELFFKQLKKDIFRIFDRLYYYSREKKRKTTNKIDFNHTSE